MITKEKFIASGVEFTVKKKAGRGCSKCAFRADPHLCTEAPDCSPTLSGADYIFKITKVVYVEKP